MKDQYGIINADTILSAGVPIYSHWEFPSERQGILPILPEK